MLVFEDGHYLLFQDLSSLMNEMWKSHELDQMTFRNIFTLCSVKWTCAGVCVCLCVQALVEASCVGSLGVRGSSDCELPDLDVGISTQASITAVCAFNDGAI